MTHRFCGDCGTRLKPTTSLGGIPRRVCPECSGDIVGVSSP